MYFQEHNVFRGHTRSSKNSVDSAMHIPPIYIEIINNTREGIVMFLQAKKGNASNGGQKIQMLK